MMSTAASLLHAEGACATRVSLAAGGGCGPRSFCSQRCRCAQHVAVVFGGDFLALPVHAGGGGVINLDAVHADVALAGFGIAGDHAGQRDEAAAILRPALQDGKIQQREILFLDDFFAWAGGDDLGEELAHIGQHGQHLQLFQKAFRRLHVEQLADAVGDFVQTIHAQRHLHAALGAELVDQHRNAVARL